MRRRHRNPSLGDVNTLLLLGVAGYLIYKLFGLGQSAATAVGKTFSDTSSGLADWLEQIFPHASSTAAFVPGSSIVLPDGTEITSDLAHGVGAFTAADGTQQFQFYFGGKIYRTMAQPDETNTYYVLTPSSLSGYDAASDSYQDFAPVTGRLFRRL
jgi:hypothetical protein